MKDKDFQKLFGQIMNTKTLTVIFIIGIVLILFPTEKGVEKEEKPQKSVEVLAYQKEMEDALEKLLSKTKGVKNAEVLITFCDDGKTIFAQDESEEAQNGESGKKNYKTEMSVILKNDAGGGQSPLVISEKTPVAESVLVVAKGVSEAEVKSEIINAVRALLGVKVHRIAVLEKQ